MSNNDRRAIEPSKKESISCDKILGLVCDYFDISTNTITSKSRKREVVWPRQVSMYLMSYYSSEPLSEIGKIFGRDHTTVIHGRETVRDLIYSDRHLRDQLNELMYELNFYGKTRSETIGGGEAYYPGHA